MTLKVDSLINDRYRIVKTLAQSGMGTVYLGHDEVLNVDIAIKENLYTTEGHSRQFRREATILAKLRHPNLPRVIDHFVIEDSGEYLVMDYVEGQDLSERLKALDGPLDEDEAVRIAVVVCEALAYLHSRLPPVIHRDIKPGNIKITPDGHVAVVDFGLAKTYQQGEMTATGAQGITPGYSPVEQYGQGTDARSDIYALGATLYTLLTNKIPPESLERALGSDGVIPIRDINPGASQPLVEVIEKAMMVESDARYQTAQDFQKALLEAHPLPDFTLSKPVVSAAPSEKKASPELVEPTMQAPPPPEKKRRVWMWIVPLVLVLVAAGVGAYFIFGNVFLPSPQPTASPSPTEAVVNVVTTAAPTETMTSIPPTLTLTPTDVQPTATMTEALAAPAFQIGGAAQLAFVSERAGGVPQIFLMNLEDKTVEQLTDSQDGACQPAWSSDGSKLAYISPCAGRQNLRYDAAEIYVLNLATGVSDFISTVPIGNYDPAWSPDDTQIAYTSLEINDVPKIFIYDVATASVALMEERSASSQMPAWSPDGSSIYFISLSPVGNYLTLFVEPLDGEGDRDGLLGDFSTAVFRPDVSPDGQWVIFDFGPGDGIGWVEPPDRKINRVDTIVLYPENVSYSPDGRWIVLDGKEGTASRDIFIMRTNGASKEQQTTDPADDYQPAWRPLPES